MHKKQPPQAFDENPEWTPADFARAKPAGEVHGAEQASMLVKRARGPQKAPKSVDFDPSGPRRHRKIPRDRAGALAIRM